MGFKSLPPKLQQNAESKDIVAALNKLIDDLYTGDFTLGGTYNQDLTFKGYVIFGKDVGFQGNVAAQNNLFVSGNITLNTGKQISWTTGSTTACTTSYDLSSNSWQIKSAGTLAFGVTMVDRTISTNPTAVYPSANAGVAAALPATPNLYCPIYVNGVLMKFPVYVF